MLDSAKKYAANKQAYEVAYAIFRIAAIIEELSIAEVLKREAVAVLEKVVAIQYAEAERPLAILDHMVRFAVDMNLITATNGEILSREAESLKIMIAGCQEAKPKEVDLSILFPHQVPMEEPAMEGVSSHNFFSEEGIAASRAEEYQSKTSFRSENSSEPTIQPDAVPILKVAKTDPEKSGNNLSGGFLKSGMRQIAILDKIRQSGNCRLRDILEILPDSSERTIRYDLESLMERRLIERIGNGGPSVSYRMRQI